jgi:phytoene/squalene synthetase
LRSSLIDAIEKKISLNPILNSFQNTIKKYNIEWMLIDTFLDSMEYDLNSQSCDDETYKRYIKGSAESVGLMCLQIFTNNNKGQYQQLKPYAESLGSAFQKINFLRDINEDYNSLNRVYFPDLDIENFNNIEKKKIEEDIEKDFADGLKGIKLLDIGSKKGVFLAYKYYMSLFHKIQQMDAQKILLQRIRISNIKKVMILILSQIQIKFQ